MTWDFRLDFRLENSVKGYGKVIEKLWKTIAKKVYEPCLWLFDPLCSLCLRLPVQRLSKHSLLRGYPFKHSLLVFR